MYSLSTVKNSTDLSRLFDDVPSNTYAIGDIDALRKKIYEKSLKAFSELPPVKYGFYSLHIENPYFVGDEKFSIKDEHSAIITEKDLNRKIVGELVLRNDNTGEEIARRKVTLVNVPYLTRHGSFIFNGNSYAISNQTRLKPGVFVRIKENGEVDSFVNTTAGVHHYTFNPESGVFYMKVGQAIIPLLSVLRFFNVPEEEVKKYWGEEVYKANRAAAANKSATKLFRGLPEGEAAKLLTNFFNTAKLDPSTTVLTLGVAADHVTPEVILRSTNKMLRVFRNEEDPDERDAIVFQRVIGPDDLIAEYIRRVHNGLWKYIPRVVRKNYNLNVIPTGYYDAGISDLLYGSGLAEILEEINPTETLDRLTRITKLGKGGIEDDQAIPDEARSVHPTHMGFIDPAVAGKLRRVGVDLRIAWPVRRDDNGRIYTIFRDVRQNKFVWRSPEEIASSVVAFPNELKSGKKYVFATKNGKSGFFSRDDVDYELPYGEQYFNQITNFVPAPGADFLQRVMMGQQMHLQAVPLLHREEPLVQSKIPFKNTSFQREASKYYGAVYADEDGTVVSVSNDEIAVRGKGNKIKRYELYNNYPFNRKTFLHNYPLVKVGDRVSKGMIIASSNFTTNEGYPAFGINAYAAIIPYLGYNYEDAFVVSESFAKKLSSEHMYQYTLDIDDSIIIGRDKFKSIFPGKYPESFYEKYDENGIIKPNKIVNPGEPIILAVKQTYLDGRNVKKRYYVDGSITWDHLHEGVSIDTYRGKSGLYANIKSKADTIVGDKLSGRFGDKGVIAKIVPDSEMPVDSNGNVFDILVNPQGLISRANPNQLLELWFGKIAKQKGQPIFLPAFHEDFYKYLVTALKENNVSPTDTIYDPKLGIRIPNVATGYKYIMKLHHMAETKLQERDFASYTSEGMPAKGGKSGAKYVGYLELMGLLGHGAFNVIKDSKFVRGQKKENFWFRFMRGENPEIDTYTFVFDKLVNQLRAAGINVTFNDNKIHLFALTRSDIDELAKNRILKNSQTVKVQSGDIVPVEGGLYDPYLSGGLNGNYWSAIALSETMPNPIIEDVIKSLLELSTNDYIAIIRGEKSAPGADVAGIAGLKKVLENLNPSEELIKAVAEYKSAPESRKSSILRKIRYLKVLQERKVNPSEWFWDKFPVLPPVFRPISSTNRTLIVPDINALYQDLYEANEILREQKKFVDNLGDEREALYNSMKAVAGLGDPVQASHKKQELKGLIQQIIGPRAKFSVVQRKLLGTTTDIVGRAVIIPNPDLDIDHVGVPIEQARVIFKPFIIRNLIRRGFSLTDAVKNYKNMTSYAQKALQEAMQDRVVLINRAPVLHRYGVMAFYPVLTNNKTIEFNPQVIGVFAADFDGDAVQIHVPVSEEAQREAKEKMLPSKNLFSSATFAINYPAIREYALGLWLATRKVNSEKKPITVRSREELLGKVKRGEVHINDPVVLLS